MFLLNLLEQVNNTDFLTKWLIGLVVATVIAGILSGYFKARKIQPKGFRWKILGFEVTVALIGGAITGAIFGPMNSFLRDNELIIFNETQVSYWVVTLEYLVYFLLFDTWFYWLHRLMHKEPFYTIIHKIHHRSTSPNLLTTLSVNPLESLINGGFVPLFFTVASMLSLPIHSQAAAIILPTNIIMGLYVHSGYEFLPRWWHRTWVTKWFITTTFHDQHHKYFRWNFGGYTTIWDRLCGTIRPKYEADFDSIVDRRGSPSRLGFTLGEGTLHSVIEEPARNRDSRVRHMID